MATGLQPRQNSYQPVADDKQRAGYRLGNANSVLTGVVQAGARLQSLR